MSRERILVVDDNPANLKLARVVLATAGYDVRTAKDAAEAQDVVRSFEPRLILMDVQLPGMDGLELTRRLKADPATRNVSVVALTAYAMKGDEEKARAAGCDGYIPKPIDTRTLPATVASYLDQSDQGAPAPRPANEAPARQGQARILVVEDNPITRKMYRFALESEGYAVTEVGEGRSAIRAVRESRPDLVVQDLVLPDMDGLAVLAGIRDARREAPIPVVALSGLAAKLDDLRARGGTFDDFLTKPAEPSRLLEVIRARLGGPPAPAGDGQHRRVLVVDDEPMNLKLADLRLREEGFSVTQAADGEEALARALQDPPDAILADVLMPRMDGFELCLSVRREPRLEGVPVVLTSSSFVEEKDRELAGSVGASALVVRTPDLREAGAALSEVIGRGRPDPPPAPAGDFERAYRERLLDHLDRQVRLNRALSQRTAQQTAALSVLSGICEALARPPDLGTVLSTVLVHCLDATGLSTGLLYMLEPDATLKLQAGCGLPPEGAAVVAADLERSGLLPGILESGLPRAFTGRAVPPEVERILALLDQTSILVVPLVALGTRRGLLVLSSDSQILSDQSWLAFARALSGQLAQAVALGEAMSRLAASELEYRSLFERATEGVFRTTPEGRFLTVNPALARILGYESPEELIASVTDIGAELYVDAADGEATLRELSKRDSIPRFEARLRRKDGSIAWVRLRWVAVRDEDGSLVHLEGMAEDITEQKGLEEQFLQVQKMEAMGRLAGGVAHDFNNLLTVINGYARMLRRGLPAESPLVQGLDEIALAGERAAALTQQLLAFSRKQVLEKQVLSLNDVVKDLSTMLRRLIGEDVELVGDFATGLWRVLADRGRMEQVLVNLAVNARDAMPRGGKLVISTRNVAAGETEFAGETRPWVALSVADTGIGIDPAARGHLFEPFFTTKEQGKGTGLGLATVYGIVRQSGGHIRVASEPGRGATFEVYLPRAEARRRERGARNAAAPPPGESSKPFDPDTLAEKVAQGK